MTALAADRNTKQYPAMDIIDVPVKAAAKIYCGSLVCFERSSGYAVPASNTAGLIFAGVAMEQADNTSGSSGDISVRVRTKGVFLFVGSSLAITSKNRWVFAADDQTVQLASAHVPVGKIKKYVSATEAWVEIGHTPQMFSLSAYFRAAITNVAQTPVDDLERSRPFAVLRGYATALTAPGSTYITTITVTDGTTAGTITITGAATKGESEALFKDYAADTNVDISAVSDNASAATADTLVIFECMYLD